jgi:hypothetical protein
MAHELRSLNMTREEQDQALYEIYLEGIEEDRQLRKAVGEEMWRAMTEMEQHRNRGGMLN